MMSLRTLKYEPSMGRDMLTSVGEIAFKPSDYKDKAKAAHAFHEALKQFAKDNGYDPKNVIMNPDYQDNPLCVCWEEGPYQWGQYMTEYLHAHGWYTEPCYSFDVTFTE